MGHRWFNLVVVLFWLCSMTWLMVAKVFPPLQVGDPPSYRSLYSVADEQQEPICWELFWNDRPIGNAITQLTKTRAGITEVKSQVHFSRLPVEDVAPPLLRPLLRSAIPAGGSLSLDADSRIDIDPLGQLVGFQSSMRPGGQRDAVVVLRGKVQGSLLIVTFDTGGGMKPIEQTLPSSALIGDELSPQARMPGLHVGQTWTVKVYNPLRGLGGDLEVLQAKVEGPEMLLLDNEPQSVLVVVYRTDSGSILGGSREPRGKLWVASDGAVLKQVTYLFGKRLTFLRADAERSAELVDAANHRSTERNDEDGRRVKFRLPRLDGTFDPGP